eukprot:138638_1
MANMNFEQIFEGFTKSVYSTEKYMLSQILSNIKHKFNANELNPSMQQALKSIYDSVSAIQDHEDRNNSMENYYQKNEMFNPVELKSIPSKCIHNKFIYGGSSKSLITFLLGRLNSEHFTDAKFRLLTQMNGIASLCGQCIVEFVIQTNKFEYFIDLIRRVYKSKCTAQKVYLGWIIIFLFSVISTQSKITKLFCSKNRHISVTIKFFKTISSEKYRNILTQIIRIAPQYNTQDARISLCFRYSSFFGLLLAAFSEKHFKVVAKMRFLQFLCDSICSDIFGEKDLKIDCTKLDGINKYDLVDKPLVKEFQMLYEIYKHKYPNIIKSNLFNDIIIKLENWNCQTKELAHLLRVDHETSRNVIKEMDYAYQSLFGARFGQKDFEQGILGKHLRNSTAMCFNAECSRYIKKIGVKVKWKLLLCSGCKIALYCNKQCQKYHWKYGHRKQCKWFQKHI